MSILQGFSEKERDYHLYQSRQNALRVESTRQQCLEDVELKLIESEQRLAAERMKSEQKIAQLVEQLRVAGIKPK